MGLLHVALDVLHIGLLTLVAVLACDIGAAPLRVGFAVVATVIARTISREGPEFDRKSFLRGLNRSYIPLNVLFGTVLVIIAWPFGFGRPNLVEPRSSSMLLALVIVGLIIQPRGARNPVVRGGALATTGFGLLVAVSLIAEALAPSFFSGSSGVWAGRVTGFAFIAAVVPSLRVGLRDFFLFEPLNRRLADVRRRREALAPLVQHLDDSASRPRLSEVFRVVVDREVEADKLFQGGKRERAEAPLLQAEKELEHLSRVLKQRISLSLRDEVKSRLDEAVADCRVLDDEMREYGVESTGLDQTLEQLESLRSQLVDPPEDLSDVAKWLTQYDTVLSKVPNTRTALRFLVNSNDSLGQARELLQAGRQLELVSSSMGLDVSALESSRVRLEAMIDDFVRGDHVKLGSTVEQYADLQRELSDFANVRSATESICLQSHQHHLSDVVQFWIPRTCGTDESARVVICAPLECAGAPVQVHGPLLEVSQGPIGQLYGNEEADLAVGYVSLSGKRAGQSDLIVTLGDAQSSRPHVFRLRVLRSARDNFRDSLIVGPSLGSVVVLAVRLVGSPWVIAVPVGAGLAGLGVLLWPAISVVRRMRRRSRSRHSSS